MGKVDGGGRKGGKILEVVRYPRVSTFSSSAYDGRSPVDRQHITAFRVVGKPKHLLLVRVGPWAMYCAGCGWASF